LAYRQPPPGVKSMAPPKRVKAMTLPSLVGEFAAAVTASPKLSAASSGGAVYGSRATAPNAIVPPVKPVPSAAKAIAWVVELPSSPIPSRSVNVSPSSAA
jgi:hypothetical protein